MKRLSILLGLILLIFATVWQFALKNNFNQRFPTGWSWTVNSIGHSSFADEAGAYPADTTTEDDPINVTEREVTVEDEAAPAGQVKLHDHYLTRDPATSTVTWEISYDATVDQTTGQYLEGEFAGQYYFPPQNLDKNQTYAISNSSYRNVPMSFQREEAVNGINTYLYAFHGDLNNATAYPDVPLEANQTIICFDFSLEYWLEPNTGEIVKFREWCEGDYIVNQDTGERLGSISRWGAETASDDLLRRVGEVQGMLFQWQLRNLYLPIGLAVLGLIFLLLGLIPGRSSSPAKTS